MGLTRDQEPEKDCRECLYRVFCAQDKPGGCWEERAKCENCKHLPYCGTKQPGRWCGNYLKAQGPTP